MREVSLEADQRGGGELKRRRKTETFNLAFLDIMSCGLGAIILVFMLVKQDVEPAHSEAGELKSEIAEVEQKIRQLATSLGLAEKELGTRTADIKKVSGKLASLEKAQASAQASAASEQKRLEDLTRTIENTQIKQKADLIEQVNVGEETYLIGLKVEGRRIAIMVDASASMTDDTLLDIIRRKGGSDAERLQGPKWKRTQATLGWLLARVPKTSQVSVVAFNDKAKVLGQANWAKGDDQGALNAVLTDIKALVPGGPTDLHAGLTKVNELSPTSIYVITDGLPTTGPKRYGSLNPFSSCSSLFGRSSRISGECRASIFRQTVSDLGLRPGRPVNVVLLPIEGDPGASHEFWRWTNETGGILISPADNWP